MALQPHTCQWTAVPDADLEGRGQRREKAEGRVAVQASHRELSRHKLREPQEQPECGRGHSGDATETWPALPTWCIC